MSNYRPDPSRELLITRDLRDLSTPWSGLRFTLPPGSDELWERLKELYPEYRNHHQRQIKALIDFLIVELEENQRGGSTTSSIVETSGIRNSPREVEDSLAGSENQSPASCASPAPALSPPRSRLSQSAPLSSDPTKAQMLVWSIADGNEVKQKGRRKMSQQERLDYRETRMKGACALCRGKKNKCTHTRELPADESTPEASARPRKRPRSTDLPLSPLKAARVSDSEEDIDEPFQSPGTSRSEKPTITNVKVSNVFNTATSGPNESYSDESYNNGPWDHPGPATSSGAQQNLYVPTNVPFPLGVYPTQVPEYPAYQLNTQVPEQMEPFDPSYPIESSSTAREELSTPFHANDSFYFPSEAPYNTNPWTESAHPYSRTSKPP